MVKTVRDKIEYSQQYLRITWGLLYNSVSVGSFQTWGLQLACKSQRQDCQFQASLGYKARLCLKI